MRTLLPAFRTNRLFNLPELNFFDSVLDILCGIVNGQKRIKVHHFHRPGILAAGPFLRRLPFCKLYKLASS